MKTAFLQAELPELINFPESERTSSLQGVLTLCQLLKEQVEQRDRQLGLQAEQLGFQAEQLQALKDEIAILKGEKPRPKIKPSTHIS